MDFQLNQWVGPLPQHCSRSTYCFLLSVLLFQLGPGTCCKIVNLKGFSLFCFAAYFLVYAIEYLENNLSSLSFFALVESG